MKACKLNKKNQTGFSLIEVLIVVGILGAVIYGVVTMYTSYKGRAAVNAFAFGSIELAVNIREAFLKVDRTYENVTTANVKASPGVIPSAMIVGDNVQNPWGGAITFAAANYASGTKNAIAITSPGVPKEACLRVAKILRSSFIGLTINGTEVKGDSKKMTSVAISSACNADKNTMIFIHQ